MDGILIINKEKGISSHDICNKLRRILNTKKVGHTGTLDPLATGVVVVAINKATKLIEHLENHVKKYIAEVKLGYETTTYDITGEVIKEGNKEVSLEAIDEAIAKLSLTTTQLPPIYSAIKVNGRKLYNYALLNEEVEIKERPIKIYEAKRVSDLYKIDNDYYFQVELEVSKGFYVRSFIHDLGIMLKTYATMSNLNRTKAGDYELKDAQTLQEVEDNGPKIIPVTEILKALPTVKVNEFFKKLVLNGVVLDKRFYQGKGLFKVTYNDKIIAVYEEAPGVMRYKPVVILGD